MIYKIKSEYNNLSSNYFETNNSTQFKIGDFFTLYEYEFYRNVDNKIQNNNKYINNTLDSINFLDSRIDFNSTFRCYNNKTFSIRYYEYFYKSNNKDYCMCFNDNQNSFFTYNPNKNEINPNQIFNQFEINNLNDIVYLDCIRLSKLKNNVKDNDVTDVTDITDISEKCEAIVDLNSFNGILIMDNSEKLHEGVSEGKIFDLNSYKNHIVYCFGYSKNSNKTDLNIQLNQNKISINNEDIKKKLVQNKLNKVIKNQFLENLKKSEENIWKNNEKDKIGIDRSLLKLKRHINSYILPYEFLNEKEYTEVKNKEYTNRDKDIWNESMCFYSKSSSYLEWINNSKSAYIDSKLNLNPLSFNSLYNKCYLYVFMKEFNKYKIVDSKIISKMKNQNNYNQNEKVNKEIDNLNEYEYNTKENANSNIKMNYYTHMRKEIEKQKEIIKSVYLDQIIFSIDFNDVDYLAIKTKFSVFNDKENILVLAISYSLLKFLFFLFLILIFEEIYIEYKNCFMRFNLSMIGVEFLLFLFSILFYSSLKNDESNVSSMKYIDLNTYSESDQILIYYALEYISYSVWAMSRSIFFQLMVIFLIFIKAIMIKFLISLNRLN